MQAKFEDLLSKLPGTQLKRLAKLIAAERKRRNPESDPKLGEMSDAEFRDFVNATLKNSKGKNDE